MIVRGDRFLCAKKDRARVSRTRDCPDNEWRCRRSGQFQDVRGSRGPWRVLSRLENICLACIAYTRRVDELVRWTALCSTHINFMLACSLRQSIYIPYESFILSAIFNKFRYVEPVTHCLMVFWFRVFIGRHASILSLLFAHCSTAPKGEDRLLLAECLFALATLAQ